MQEVKAKKALGQHFLINLEIAKRIVDSLEGGGKVLEVGPGMGVLTQYLIQRSDVDLTVAEIDVESVEYLKEKYPNELDGRILEGDFLKMELNEKTNIIGNFPYNISSQIFFKVLDYKDNVDQIVGMLQKEVAVRLAATPTGKEYGILSVLLQAYYEIEYLFDVAPSNFNPPPKVESAVIRLKRNDVVALDCNEVLMKRIVKATFNQRRKTVRNSICTLYPQLKTTEHRLFSLRPERMSVADFVELTNFVAKNVENI